MIQLHNVVTRQLSAEGYDQPAGQAEQDELPGGALPAGEAALDVAGMRPLMCVLVADLSEVQRAGRCMVVPAMTMLMASPVMVVVVVRRQDSARPYREMYPPVPPYSVGKFART